MWSLQPSFKVMISFKSKIIMVFLLCECWTKGLIGWNNIKSSLGKTLSYPQDHCKATLWDLFGKVNVIGLRTRYRTSSCTFLLKYTMRTKDSA